MHIIIEPRITDILSEGYYLSTDVVDMTGNSTTPLWTTLHSEYQHSLKNISQSTDIHPWGCSSEGSTVWCGLYHTCTSLFVKSLGQAAITSHLAHDQLHTDTVSLCSGIRADVLREMLCRHKTMQTNVQGGIVICVACSLPTNPGRATTLKHT